MARYHRTEGICLRRLDFSNTSQVVSFLTPDAGRLSFLAKGVTRAPKRGIRTGFDLLGRYEIVYTARRPGSLHNLTDRWLREGFRGIRAALEPIVCGYYAAELVSNFTAEGIDCPALYALLVDTLRGLEAGRELGLAVLRLEVGVLREHGTCPFFDECAECGAPLPQHGPVAFSSAAGGPLCGRCESDVRGPARARLTTVSGRLLGDLARLVTEPGGVNGLTPRKIVAMSTVLRFHIRDLVGRELRMWSYLQGRRLSRSLRRVRRRLAPA